MTSGASWAAETHRDSRLRGYRAATSALTQVELRSLTAKPPPLESLSQSPV